MPNIFLQISQIFTFKREIQGNVSVLCISDFSTSVIWRDLRGLYMWRNIRNPHICHVEKFENIFVKSLTNIRYDEKPYLMMQALSLSFVFCLLCGRLRISHLERFPTVEDCDGDNRVSDRLRHLILQNNILSTHKALKCKQSVR